MTQCALLPTATLDEVRAILLEAGSIAARTEAAVAALAVDLAALRGAVATSDAVAQEVRDAVSALALRMDE